MSVGAARALDPHRPPDHPGTGHLGRAADVQVLPRPPTGIPEVHQIRKVGAEAGRSVATALSRRARWPSGRRLRGWGFLAAAAAAGGRLRARRPLLSAARRVGVALAGGEWEVFIFISAHHVPCLSPPGWERQAPRRDAPLRSGGGEKERGKFSRAG